MNAVRKCVSALVAGCVIFVHFFCALAVIGMCGGDNSRKKALVAGQSLAFVSWLEPMGKSIPLASNVFILHKQ